MENRLGSKLLIPIISVFLAMQMGPSNAVYQGADATGTALTLSLIPKNLRDSFCSVALLTERIAVTAAHCVIEENRMAPNLRYDGREFYVSKPGADISSDEIASRVRVSWVVTTNDYINTFDPDNNDRRTQINDIAFLFLEKPLVKNYEIEVATEFEINSAINAGSFVEHFGYGRQTTNLQDGKPWTTRLQLASLISTHLDPSRVVYSREGPSALCPGDSGGPWYLEVNGVKKIAAVTVAASGCRTPPPYDKHTLGTRIYPYLDLMKQEWLKFESLRDNAIKAGTYLEAKVCLNSDTNAELFYQTNWGYWIEVPSAVGWLQSANSCSPTRPFTPWISIPEEFQTKLRWRFWDSNSQTYSEDFVMIKNNKNRESSNSQKTALTCRKGKNVKVISGKNPKCPKGYKTNLN